MVDAVASVGMRVGELTKGTALRAQKWEAISSTICAHMDADTHHKELVSLYIFAQIN